MERVIPTFESLDEAVRASFPPEFCRIVGVREHEGAAVALSDTRPSSAPYLYEVHYQRENGRWSEGSSSNGCGWHRFNLESELGVVTAWGEAPAGADRVRGELEGQLLEDAVAKGVYLLVWWDVPVSDARVTGFRIGSGWVRAPTMREQFLAQRAEWLRARGS